jgi:hypothetical protein
VLTEFNVKWAKGVQSDWLLEHLRLRHVAQSLLAADEATALGWSIDLRLARARALRASDPGRGLADLRALYQANPAHKRIKFAYAAALLNENDEAGVNVMEALAREDAAFRAPAFLRVLTYFQRKGDTPQIERWSKWLKRASQNLGEAVSAFLVQAELGQVRLSSLQVGEQAAISEAGHLDPCVAKTWLFEGDAQLQYSSDRPAVPMLVHLLVLAIDPAEAQRLVQDEESIAERYEDLLRMLIAPDQVPLVRTYFTTEKMPAGYTARPNLSLNTDARQPARAG